MEFSSFQTPHSDAGKKSALEKQTQISVGGKKLRKSNSREKKLDSRSSESRRLWGWKTYQNQADILPNKKKKKTKISIRIKWASRLASPNTLKLLPFLFFLVIVIVINIIIISNFIIKATISSIKGGNKDSRTEGREHGQWKNHGFN